MFLMEITRDKRWKRKMHMCNVAAAVLGWKSCGMWDRLMVNYEDYLTESQLDEIMNIAESQGFVYPHKKVKNEQN